MSSALVFDADIFRGASERSRRGLDCARVMKAALTICHRAAVSADLMEEWKRHRSGFSHRWLNQMFGKKKVILLSVPQLELLRTELSALEEPCRSITMKDVHLIECAIASGDRVVVSCDERARACFAAMHTNTLQGVVWVNPERGTSEVIAWLERGVLDEQSMLLQPSAAAATPSGARGSEAATARTE